MFLEIVDMINMNGGRDDAIQLRLNPFSLRGKTINSLYTLQPGSITK